MGQRGVFILVSPSSTRKSTSHLKPCFEHCAVEPPLMVELHLVKSTPPLACYVLPLGSDTFPKDLIVLWP
jgi:hypothetical protein